MYALTNVRRHINFLDYNYLKFNPIFYKLLELTSKKRREKLKLMHAL